MPGGVASFEFQGGTRGQVRDEHTVPSLGLQLKKKKNLKMKKNRKKKLKMGKNIKTPLSTTFQIYDQYIELLVLL